MIKCKSCGLSSIRRKLVQDNVIRINEKGKNILFVTDFPAFTDEALGKFGSGIEAKFIKQLFLTACPRKFKIKSIHITGLVHCVPRNSINGAIREPRPGEVLSCFKWLHSKIAMTKPTALFFNGVLVNDYCKEEYKAGCWVLHTRAMIKQGGIASPFFQRTVSQIREVLKND